jgi:hypothetical protein
MSRNPLYTVLGLGLLVAQYLSPREPTTSVVQQREQPSIEFLRRVSSLRTAAKAAESVVVALYAATILTLAALWANSMSNTYAQNAEVRCGALAMADFAALMLRLILIATAVVWGVSIFARCFALRLVLRARRPSLPVAWILVWVWLTFSSCLFLSIVSLGHALIEHLPNGFPPSQDQANCVELLTGRQDDLLDRLLDWLFLSNGRLVWVLGCGAVLAGIGALKAMKSA